MRLPLIVSMHQDKQRYRISLYGHGLVMGRRWRSSHTWILTIQVTIGLSIRSRVISKTSDILGLSAPSLTIEHVLAGRKGGGVPDHATLRIDRRILPAEDAAQVEKQLTKMPGTRCRIRRSVFIPAMAGGEASNSLRDVVADQLQQRLGEEMPITGVAFDHEGRHYAAHGIPTIMYGAGPMDLVKAGMHGKDESLKLDDLRLATEVLACSTLKPLKDT